MFALTRGAVFVCVLWVMCVCVRCVGMCSVWVCGVCWCFFDVFVDVFGCVRCCVVVVCRTHPEDHGIHFHIDVHVGVTVSAHVLMKNEIWKTYFP